MRAWRTILPISLLTAVFLQPTPSYSGTLFYVNATADIGTSLPTTTLGGGGVYAQSGGTNGNLQQTTYSLPPMSHSDSVTAFDPVANGLFTDTASASVYLLSVDGPSLHAWIGSQGGTLDPNTVVNGTAYRQLFWVDTLFVTGLPTGTPVLLQLTTSLDGSYVVSGNTAPLSQLIWRPSLNQALTGNVCGQPANYVTQYSDITVFTTTSAPAINSVQTVDFCTTAGAPLTFEEQLGAQLLGVNTWFGEANLSNTANTYIDVLTPGAGLTSASGVDYSTPSPVPEPSSFLLLSASLLTVGFSARWRR